MTIDEALEDASASPLPSRRAYLADGAIHPDPDPAMFRLYPDDSNPFRYFVVRKDDVKGKLYRWSRREVAARGLVGQARFTVPLKVGATLVEVQSHLLRVGESLYAASSNGDQTRSS